jgi:hypothetical protein
MNKQKVLPNEMGIESGQKKGGVKRVSFEKEQDAACKPVQNINTIGKSMPLKPSKEPRAQVQVTKFDNSAPNLKVALHPAPISQHEEISRPPAHGISRRRVKSMPAGSVASRDFFCLAEATPPSARNTCLDALEVLHEDRIVAEIKLLPQQEVLVDNKPYTQPETNMSTSSSEQQMTNVHQEQKNCCIIL